MSSELSNGSSKPWSFWSDKNYLDHTLFRGNSPVTDLEITSVSVPVSKEASVAFSTILSPAPVKKTDVKIENLISNALPKSEPLQNAPHPKKVLRQSSFESPSGNAENGFFNTTTTGPTKLTNVKAQGIVDKTLAKNQCQVPTSKPNLKTEVNKTKVDSTNAKTKKIVKTAIPKAQPQPKSVAASPPKKQDSKPTENTPKVAAKATDAKTKTVVKGAISTAQASVHPIVVTDNASPPVKKSSHKPSETMKWIENKNDLSNHGDKAESGPCENTLVISQEITKKVTLKDIDAELSSPIAAAEYFLNGALEEELKQLGPERLLSIYTKLLQRSVLAAFAEKGKLSDDKMEQVRAILNKHLDLLESGLIAKNDAVFFPLLYPLIEICVNSSMIESCQLGLKLMIDFFSQPNPPKEGREVQLIEKFLIGRKKVVFTCENTKSEDRKIVFEKQYTLLQETISTLENVFFNAAPLIKYPEIALTFDVKDGASIKYFLVWLEKIHSSDQPYVETLTDKVYYAHLIRTLGHCGKNDFEKVFNFFECLPLDKINFKNPQCSIQKVLQRIFTKKFIGGTDIKPKLYILSEYCMNIWKFSPTTVNALKNDFERHIFSIREHITQPLPLFINALQLLILQAESQNAVRLQKKLETPKRPEKTSSIKRKKSQNSKSNQESNEDDIAKNIHFKAASTVFDFIFNSAMNFLPENKADKKRILNNLWDLSLKAQLNFEFDNQSLFLLSYIDCCNLEMMDLESEDMIMDILKKIDCEDQLKTLTTDKISGVFIKKCIQQGCDSIMLLDTTSERVNLYNNMMVLVDMLMKCDVETQEKIDAFSILLSILSKSYNRDHLADPLYTIFNLHKHVYENHTEMYWEHYYNFGNFKDKKKLQETETTKEQLPLRRETIQKVTTRLCALEGTMQNKLVLEILKNTEHVEFEDHFNALKDCYCLVLDNLLNDKDVHESLRTMNVWFEEQFLDENNPESIFIKTVPYLNKELYSKTDQQAHRDLMMKFVTTYKTICEKSIELDRTIQKNCCETFVYNIAYMIAMRGFEICDAEDLSDFEEVLNKILDVLKMYITNDFTPFILENLYKKTLEVFSRASKATLKQEAIDSAKSKFIEKWAVLFPQLKFKTKSKQIRQIR